MHRDVDGDVAVESSAICKRASSLVSPPLGIRCGVRISSACGLCTLCTSHYGTRALRVCERSDMLESLPHHVDGCAFCSSEGASCGTSTRRRSCAWRASSTRLAKGPLQRGRLPRLRRGPLRRPDDCRGPLQIGLLRIGPLRREHATIARRCCSARLHNPHMPQHRRTPPCVTDVPHVPPAWPTRCPPPAGPTHHTPPAQMADCTPCNCVTDRLHAACMADSMHTASMADSSHTTCMTDALRANCVTDELHSDRRG